MNFVLKTSLSIKNFNIMIVVLNYFKTDKGYLFLCNHKKAEKL